MTILDAVPPEGSEITVVQLRLAPLSFTHWNSSRFLESFNYVMHCWRWNIQISSYLSLKNIVFKHFNNFLTYCWQTGDPRPIFAPKGLDLSWMLLLYQIIITITCWHHLFQITSLFNQFTSLLALNCSCPNFFWNVLQVWMTGKDVYLQMTWSWPDKTWNILCSYCLQWNTSQSKFRNHYFLFLFAFSILSQLFLIWGCRLKGLVHPKIIIYSPYVCRILGIDSLGHQSLSQHNNFPYGESEGWLRSFSLAFSFVFHGRKKVIQVWNNMSVSNTKYLTIDRQKEIELCQLSLILNSFIIIKERLLDICITCLYTHTENK